MKIIQFIKNWTLPISMSLGVILYFVYINLPFLTGTKLFVNHAVAIIQPVLIFLMLFLTFCKVDLSELRPCRWHAWLLLVQAGSFSLLGGILLLFRGMSGAVWMEGAMLCLICPTATAAAIITRKLGGDAAHLTSYTILSNLLTAFLVPLLVPLVHPHPGINFWEAFILILGKVFPLLLLPFVAAVLLRYLWPAMHHRLSELHDLTFYLWAFALMLAIAVTVRSIVHSHYSFGYQAGLAIVSLICCGVQFWIGKRIGRYYHDSISAGQALGQKNTVVAIWMGYTFLTPVTAVAAGFYSVWHNMVNSYQLYQQRKQQEIHH